MLITVKEKCFLDNGSDVEGRGNCGSWFSTKMAARLTMASTEELLDMITLVFFFFSGRMAMM